MSVERIASRYAKSLLDLAKDQDSVSDVLGDIQGFQKMVGVRDFYLLLKSPIVKVGKKSEIFNELFEGKVNKLTKAFFDIVLRKNREKYLPEIADEFIAQYNDMNGITPVKLITATPITDDAVEKIKAKLLAGDSSLNKVEIEKEVDESLIGGFIVKMGDKLIDASVAHRLQSLANTLTDQRYESAN